MHLPKGKPATSGRQPKKTAQAAQYPEGYFTRVMREHNFPPDFVSQIVSLSTQQERAAARRNPTELDNGWVRNGGTVVMPNTPSNPRPKWMEPSHKA